MKVLLTGCLVAAVAASAAAQTNALDRYVAQRDPVYAWKVVTTLPGNGTRTDVLELTSQTWRSAAEVDRPVWKHWLSITRPTTLKSRKALLFIGAGSNNDPAPSTVSERSARIARETGTVVADLAMVPNQPLRFTDSMGTARVEDDIIAYSRVKHFETKDATWLVRMAMVKSAVRAMDAVQEFTASPRGGGVQVEEFVVSGASKRGWTTWLVGAVDPRVVAIIPVVIDALNSQAITKHHFEAYGFFSPALDDYVRHGIFPHKIDTPEYRSVLRLEDPYEYRDRPALKMPKFLINAAGDEYFLPDNSQFYYGDLTEEKHLRYVPNAKHNLAGTDATESLLAFYKSVIQDLPRPRFSWTKEKDGTLVVTSADTPAAVTLWQATNPDARDFRLDTIGTGYTATPLKLEKGVYTARVRKPKKGYTAFFVELAYPGPGQEPFKFTTEVSVVPGTVCPSTGPTPPANTHRNDRSNGILVVSTVSDPGRILAKAGLALVAYAVIEGAIFHTHLYDSILEPESTTGHMELFFHNEIVRPKPEPRQVVAVGDSRMGFLPRIGNELLNARGYGFGSIALGGTTPRTWYYYELRAVDPTAKRYSAILIPSPDFNEPEQYDYLDNRELDLHYIVARIGLQDLFDLPASFPSTEMRWETTRAILARGYVFRKDFEDFIAHPFGRLEKVRMYKRESAGWYYGFNGEDFSLDGIQVDWANKQIQYPPQLSPAQQESVKGILFRDRPERDGRMERYLRTWYGRIIDRYKGTGTKLIFLRVARGPVHPPEVPPYPRSVVRSLAGQPNVIILPEHRFDVLERADYFGDAMHMNGPGMRAFSKMLAEETVAALEGAK